MSFLFGHWKEEPETPYRPFGFASFEEESEETCGCGGQFPNGNQKKELEEKVKDLTEQLAVANEALTLAANDAEKYEKLYEKKIKAAKLKKLDKKWYAVDIACQVVMTMLWVSVLSFVGVSVKILFSIFNDIKIVKFSEHLFIGNGIAVIVLFVIMTVLELSKTIFE